MLTAGSGVSYRLDKFSMPNRGAFFPSLLRIVVQCFPYFFWTLSSSFCTLCMGGGAEKIPAGGPFSTHYPILLLASFAETVAWYGAHHSDLDVTCRAGNCVDLSKLDPHHTFSSSGVPLSKERRPWALPFTMEKCGAFFPVSFQDRSGIFPILKNLGQKFSCTKISPSVYIVAFGSHYRNPCLLPPALAAVLRDATLQT